MAKIKLDDIRLAAEEHSWELLSTEYKNLDTNLIFICSEGHKVELPYKKVRDKWECPICKQNKYFNFRTEIIPKKKGIMRVLSLDQATHNSGFAIFDGTELVNANVFITESSDEIVRDIEIKNWLIQVIQNWKPDIIGIEDIQLQQFGDRNVGVTTYRTLARLQGILMATCYEQGVECVVCHPAKWRAHCDVKGRSRLEKKRSMQAKVKDWFDITVTDDVADAIGIGKYVSETQVRKKVEIIDWE